MKNIRIETGICHLEVTESISLQEFLEQADLTPLTVQKNVSDWLDWGCVYIDGLRQRENVNLAPGQVIRLHTRPKKYQLNFQRLSDHIVAEEDDFLVLNKPAGLPTHATLDNFKDNAKYILEAERGQPVYTTHRLDIPTQGLLIIAKTPEAQAHINKLFARRAVTKIYRAIAEQAIPKGQYIHHMDPEGHVPRTLKDSPQDGWWPCVMEIHASVASPAGPIHEIQLHTGRTHQIRAQMAHLGAPLLGDTAYGSRRNFGGEVALESHRMEFEKKSFKVPDGNLLIRRFCAP